MHMSTDLEHESDNSFGHRLAAERKLLGLSQKDAAERCGVRREMWGRYERGEAEPGVSVLEHFCALGAKPGALLGVKALEDTDGVHAVLDEIAAQLGLFNEMHQLEGIAAQLLRDRATILNDSEEREHSVASPDTSPWSFENVRNWLSQSPYFLPDGTDLEKVIERLEFGLSVSGRSMDHYDKASAIVRLWRETRACKTARDADRMLASKVRELIEKLPD